MNRKMKNVSTILIIIIIIFLSFGTMILAKNSVQSTSNDSMKSGMSAPPGGNTPPEKPGESNTDSENNKQNLQPNQENSEQSNKNDNTRQENKSSDSQNESKEANNNQNQGMQQPPDGNIDIIYNILFGIEALAISILISLLIISKFYAIPVKNVFAKTTKLVLYIVIIAILTSALTYLQIYVTNNIIIDNTQSQTNNMLMPEGGQMGASNVSYTAIKEITEDTTVTDETIESTNTDENALLADGSITVNIENSNISKTGDSEGGDTSNFYGNNSAVLAKNGATLNLKNLVVNTKASGANGVFSYGGSATTDNSSSDGTTVNISDSKITTTGDNAGGIMTTGGGTTKASNLTINTSGTSSAAIRTDRGGGTVTVNKGSYTTTGKGSPAIYSTADITTSNATLEAKASEGVVIEGANSVSLNNCKLIDNNTELNGQSTTYKNIFLYQSMSGDASNGNATFTANDSSITTNKGDSFYITNTTATINLKNNTIINNDTTGNFLRAQKDSWGKSGSNGGTVSLVMEEQTAKGNIVIDSISTLDMKMNSNSYYEGTINGENQAKEIKLTLDESSKIKLTGDSYVTSLEDADDSYSNIDFNGYTLYVNGNPISK